ncbi:PRC-barrel-like protein [Artemisia annua]|uniref:PRC-barrel-like protein n=1 Tax=Artemisia annua TaxID=35608 RepID=A0A2U1MJK0_ARTAN|nr:PRC-barrel-like protein [Artemisia annua]
MCDCISSSLSPYSFTKHPFSHPLNPISKHPTKFSLKTSQNPNPPQVLNFNTKPTHTQNTHFEFSKKNENLSENEEDLVNFGKSTVDFGDEKNEKVKTQKTHFEFSKKVENLSENDEDLVKYGKSTVDFGDEKNEKVKTQKTHFEFSKKVENLSENDEDLVKYGKSTVDFGDGKSENVKVVKKGKELVKRGNVIAKQVISIQSALSLGFVSQLWVDTNTWMVVIVEVRPNLLSGEQERFFLEDTVQVGDVVLVEDETVMDNELKLVGLETLVGYSVVTPGRRDIGKVRGYTFNINSGAIESLELDSFGISIIPSSLVSTYALLVEDVLEVVSDTVVVHEAAASRIQRLTRGFWDAKRMSYSMDDLEDYTDLEDQSDYRKTRRRRPGGSSQRPQKRPVDDTKEDWDLPMDYL